MIENGMLSITIALIAIVVAWVVGLLVGLSLRSAPRPAPVSERKPGRSPKVEQGALLSGLDALIEGQSDAGVDALLTALDVGEDHLETHLAIGALLRERGDTDKAIRLHQNMLARPALTQLDRGRVELELARDFIAGGRVERAAKVLAELDIEHKALRRTVLEVRLAVRVEQLDWSGAAEAADGLIALGDKGAGRVRAHAGCEMAEQALLEGDSTSARARLAEALSADPACVRATLALARIERDGQRWKEVVELLEGVPDQDDRFVLEALPMLVRAHQELGAERDLRARLEAWLTRSPSTPLAQELAELVASEAGAEEAERVLAETLAIAPSIRGLLLLLDRGEGSADAAAFEALRAHCEALVADAPDYVCNACGAGSDVLEWRCSACGSWGTSGPAVGLLWA